MAIEINETTPLWWELQNIPTQLIRELRRRKANNNIGINYLNPNDADESFKDKFDPAYKGPLTPWVRVFSNSTGIPRKGPQTVIPISEYLGKTSKDGFLLRGGEGFFDAFGYKQGSSLSDSKAIIGYQANGQPHYLSGDRDQYRYSVYPGNINGKRISQNNITPSLLPPPGVISLNIKQARDFLTFGSFKFNCYGLAQLEYLTPYFLSPGINLSIEFGYNYYNRQSLLDLNGVSESYELAKTPQLAIDKALKSNGNYGCVTGIITKFNFSTTDGFLYECNTEITSRQGLFAGMKIDDVITVKDKDQSGDDQTKAYLNLKQCILNELSDESLRNIYNKQNFYDYLIGRENGKNSLTITDVLYPFKLELPLYVGPLDFISFYKGKNEDRIFTGRDKVIYGENVSPIEEIKELLPNPPPGSMGGFGGTYAPTTRTTYTRVAGGQSTINYGEGYNKKRIYSYPEDSDFDIKSNKKTWVQLDFVFELCNLFMANNKSLENKIDISEIIINAHPNLISFDKDVLIPNPRSPKINIGTKSPGGYLDQDETNRTNKFSKQVGDIQDTEHGKANDKIKEVFKVKPIALNIGIYRDNLDQIINYLYYNSRNLNKQTSAAFPFEEVPEGLESKYTKYYHGYLKHIYISIEKLKNIAKNNSNNYLEFLNSIINTINGAVDNVWDLEVVRNEKGGISIIDKNLKTKKEKIYMFEVGGTNTCIREVNFDVSLTTEQSTNIYYSNDSNTERSLAGRSPNNQYSDRLDFFFRGTDTSAGIIAKTDNSNKVISQLQTYGNQFVINQEVLQMTTRLLTDEEYIELLKTNTDNLTTDQAKEKLEKGFLNYTYLNLPSSMKGYLRKILTDNDQENNAIKYSGVSDNFQVTIVFDGIFALRNLQVFALSNLPKPYVPGNVIFQVLEVDHNIQNGSWKTNVTALLRTVGNNDTEYILV